MSIDFFGISCERALEISVSQQTTTLTGFPVLMPTPPSWHPFWEDVSPDGSDIYCVTSTGVLVPHELVSIDTSGKTIQLYAKYTLSHTADTTVYLLYKGYGNTGNVPEDAWSSYYAVYHMDSVSGSEPDATGTYDGTVTGADRNQTGKVGKSMLFTAGDTSDRVTAAGPGNWEYTQPWSVSCYAKPSSAATLTVLSKYEPITDARGWSTGFAASGSDVVGTLILSNDNSPTARVYVQTTNAFATGSWMHMVYTNAGTGLASGCHIYVDGSDEALTVNDNNLSSGTILNSATFAVGAQYGVGTQTAWFDGYLDEVRVASTAVTQDWVTAERNNLNNPNTFSSIVGTHSRTLHRCCPQPMNPSLTGCSTRYHPAHTLLLATRGWMGSPGNTISGFTS